LTRIVVVTVSPGSISAAGGEKRNWHSLSGSVASKAT
jgi:hypothetical protein